MLQIKRIYDKPEQNDGYRILVDRLWPRGISKERAAIDLWLKDIAPSPELRKWFGHKPEKFAYFKRKYLEELLENPATTDFLNLAANHATITLLYGAKDSRVNHAIVLHEFLETKNNAM